MAALGAQSIASSYEQLLHVDADGGGNSTTHVSVKDGDNGTTFGFTIATDALMMSSTNRLEFGDTGTYIHQSADGVLDLVSDTEIEINATTIDMNGALDLDGTLTQDAGAVVFNEAGADYDFRIEGSGEANALFVQGSDGNVGIGVSDPDSTLEVAGKLHVEDSSSSIVGVFAQSNATNGYGVKIQAEGTASGRYALKVLNIAEDNTYFTISTATGAVGKIGIGTAAPGQLLDINSGGGNMIADGYDTHSLAVYKENIEDASGYLDKILACPAQKWNRKPFVSANEIKEAVLEEFGEDVLIEEAVEAKEAVLDEDGNESEPAVEAKDAVYEKQYSVWDELFPEDSSHRQKALYNMPEGDLKDWIDEWCEAKRVEMRPEVKWQKKRLGLVADAELTAEHLPEVVSINDEGEPTGIDTMTYIGILHNAIQELSAKVEALEG